MPSPIIKDRGYSVINRAMVTDENGVDCVCGDQGDPTTQCPECETCPPSVTVQHSGFDNWPNGQPPYDYPKRSWGGGSWGASRQYGCVYSTGAKDLKIKETYSSGTVIYVDAQLTLNAACFPTDAHAPYVSWIAGISVDYGAFFQSQRFIATGGPVLDSELCNRSGGYSLDHDLHGYPDWNYGAMTVGSGGGAASAPPPTYVPIRAACCETCRETECPVQSLPTCERAAFLAAPEESCLADQPKWGPVN